MRSDGFYGVGKGVYPLDINVREGLTYKVYSGIIHNMNRYEFTEGYVTGYTYNGIPFYIDKEDYETIKSYQWYVKPNGYVFSSETKQHKALYLHRLIMGEPNGLVDHINRDKLDNRRSNLRLCNHSESNRNRGKSNGKTTDIIGVSMSQKERFSKRKNKISVYIYYRAYLDIGAEQINLGCYKTLEEAIKARLKGEAKYFGEFAPQRHLFEKYKIDVDK